jgi:hypothetical protein
MKNKQTIIYLSLIVLPLTQLLIVFLPARFDNEKIKKIGTAANRINIVKGPLSIQEQ